MHTYSYYDGGLSVTVLLIFCVIIICGGILQFIKIRRLVKKSGKICFKLFKRGSGKQFFISVMCCAAFTIWYIADSFTDGEPINAVFAALILLWFAVWIPTRFGFYITRSGIIYADMGIYAHTHKAVESFTARDFDSCIGIFLPSDLRAPVCTVENTPENREKLADFWREFPARKKNPYRDKLLEILKKWEIGFEDFNIDFSLPFHCQLSCLNEDIIQAERGNYLVDIGWYPESDPKGKLRLRLIENYDWQRPLAEYDDTDFDGLEKHLSEISKRVEDFYS